MLTEHTYKPFDEELESMRARVLEMGGLVEEQLHNAMTALMEGNQALAQQVIENEVHVNALEASSDQACTNIIALRSPTAGDLRMVLTILRSITDLERIGDEAVKIARYALNMTVSDRVFTPRHTEIRYLAELATRMLRQALNAFARVEVAGIPDLARQDIQVDEEYHLIIRHLVTYMMEDPRTISACIDLLFVAKAIERVGDHAKNIAKYVVYMVTGADVRHVTLEQLEHEVQKG
ncbi:MAG: phosphate signaling complex protein PhoU [Betaproteobacteria bacterium]|nr:phosphate signaling complex protein PhoU [Betaproteobacteria bacterium]